MKCINLNAKLALPLIAMAATSATAQSISDAFVRTGTYDTIAEQFVHLSTSTQWEYSGFVEIDVFGVGQSFGQITNDAFYGVPSGVPLSEQYYQLNVGWDSNPLSIEEFEPRNIDNFIAYIEGIGAVTPPSRPEYRLDHHYRFVIKVPEAPSRLQFGISDSVFTDNGGAYHIQVWQLAPVPEISSISMITLGLLALAAIRKNKVY